MSKRMNYDALTSIGFSKNEAKVYASLIRLGPSTAGAIATKSNVHRTNVYDTLERLAEKGIITYIYKGNKKLFEAVKPTQILEILKDQERKFESILPQLLLDYKLSKERSAAHIFEGIAGIRSITEDILKENKPVYTFGVPRDATEKMKSFVTVYHKKRIEKKIWQTHIYDADAKDRIKYLNSLAYTRAAYIPNEQESPATTTIYGNKVTFFIWSDPPLGILIESERIAKQYEGYFEILWKIARK